MWRCPVCEKEHLQGLVCDDCGFDSSCDYERNRTLCSALPRRTEPISVRTAKRRLQQKQRAAVSLGNHLVCPKCGGAQFFVLIDELQFMCADCETKVPVAFQTNEPVSENVIASGEAGTSVSWTLRDTEVLTIAGIGAMRNYMPYSTPWNDRREKITSVVVEPGVTKIGNYAFRGCSSLTSVTLPEGVTHIGYAAFGNCSSLTNIALPESVTYIGAWAFDGCSTLTTITLSESMAHICYGAFTRCPGLTDVYYGGTAEQWRSMEIGDANDYLLKARIHFSTAGPAYSMRDLAEEFFGKEGFAQMLEAAMGQ